VHRNFHLRDDFNRNSFNTFRSSKLKEKKTNDANSARERERNGHIIKHEKKKHFRTFSETETFVMCVQAEGHKIIKVL
jgi:hypothetical protein